ncbi:hypothetical protein ABNJ92_001251 [Vibrio parahaemolyticus]
MIKFADSIPLDDPIAYINGIVDNYWNILNPKKVNQELKKNSLCQRAESLLSEYKKNKYLNTAALGSSSRNKRHIDFLEYLVENNFDNLKRIVKAKPNEFHSIIGEAFNIINISDLTELVNGKVKSASLGHVLLKKVFFYDSFRSSDACVKFYKELGLEGKYCFYCNDSELSVISTEKPSKSNGFRSKNGKLLFDLDHFYLKSNYPFLALSFYNLIPCCGLCNSRFRGTKNFNVNTHINPYLDSFDENYIFKFDKYELATSFRIGCSELTKVEVNLKNHSIRINDKTAGDLQIMERYRTKVSHLNDILDTIIKYSHAPEEELYDLIYGVNEQHVPKSRKSILDVRRAKFSLDFLDVAFPLLED